MLTFAHSYLFPVLKVEPWIWTRVAGRSKLKGWGIDPPVTNVRKIELLIICLYSEGSEDRCVVVQYFWRRKICQIVCRVLWKWMESKFLDQDVDVVFLANKGMIIGCFVGRNYNKILMETGKFKNTLWILSRKGFYRMQHAKVLLHNFLPRS